MRLRVILRAVHRLASNWDEELLLCFGAAIVCFLLGAIGWVANQIAPGATSLHGLLVVSVFYFGLSVVRMLKDIWHGARRGSIHASFSSLNHDPSVENEATRSAA
jgi:hypothetical protein